MSNEATAKWSQAHANGVYWWRHDKSYAPEIVEVRDGGFYSIADPDPTSTSLGEFLGPITPEQFAEVGRLRKALGSMKQAAEFSLTTPGLIRGRDQLKNAVEAAAGALAPHSAERKKVSKWKQTSIYR